MEIRTIFGPPGTGKTRTLVDFANKESAKRPVMFLSYTKAAAMEAASRIGEGKPRASTIHSLAFNALGLSKASVVDQVKLLSFSKATGINFRQGIDDEEQDGDLYRGVLSYSCARMILAMDAYDQLGRPGRMGEFNNFCAQYAQWKSTYGYMDFDDMLIRSLKLELECPPVVILDEAQDCSPLQWAVFKRYTYRASRVYLAGDDDQAIFEWNGADPHGMMGFSSNGKANIRVLEQSHRIPRSIHDYVHDNVLCEIKSRVDKKFDPREELGAITRWADLTDINLNKLIDRDKSNLILVRDSYRMKEVQRALHSDMIPYSMAGSRNSPYDSGLAAAIRGHKRDGGPTDSETKMMVKFARDKSMPVDRMLKINWREAFAVPDYLQEFYDHADLFSPICTKLSTIHQAKGTEASNVVVDLTITQRVAEGIYSNRDAELRVWYVALTRAIDTLHLCGENELI